MHNKIEAIVIKKPAVTGVHAIQFIIFVLPSNSS